MKLIYVANTRIPTEKSFGMAIMKICEGLAAKGLEVELVLPTRRNPQFANVDPFIHYGVQESFRIVLLPCPDLVGLRVPFPVSFVLGLIQSFLYARALRRYLTDKKDAVLFSREQRLLYLLRKLPNFKIYEIHDSFPLKTSLYKRLYKRLLHAVDFIIVTNSWKKIKITERFNIPAEKIAVIANAVDAAVFLEQALPVLEARERLRLPLHKKLVVYVGGFQQWKGVYVLAKALKHLPVDIEIHMVGGGPEPERSKFLEYLKSKNNRGTAFVHEAVSHPDVPSWLYAADVLVAPGSIVDPRGVFYTSPLKIFEYVASGRPLVLTNLPSVREALRFALNRENLAGLEYLFVPPNDPEALADAILHRMNTRYEWSPLVSKEDMSKRLSWECRARKIISLLPKQ